MFLTKNAHKVHSFGWKMAKWVTCLVLLIALTGQVWAGVCVCLDDHSDVHSCCKPDENGKSSMAAKGCCSSDCESISSSQTPGKSNSEVSFSKLSAKQKAVHDTAATWSADRSLPKFHSSPILLFGNRLKLARPPSQLYLRHNSLLI